MRIIGIAVLLFGLLLAGGAVYVAKDYYTQYQAMLASQVPTAPETASVLAATKPLRFGDKIELATAADYLKWVTWPKDAVPEGAFVDQEELFGEDSKQIRVVLRTIEPGELILKSKLSGFGDPQRVAAQVAEGMRAVTIPIDAVSGVAGFVAPGDRVDILLTRSIEGNLVTSIILQDVQVIATDQSANEDVTRARIARTATVEVNPTAASKLALAVQVGKLSLTLRGVSGDANLDIEPVSIADLPAQPEAAPIPEPEAAPVVEAVPIVRVRKGSEITDVQVR